MFDQQQIIEDVKKLLQELDNFFTVTLKKEKLKKDTVTEKDKIYGKIKETLVKLVGEEPQEDYDDVGSYPQPEEAEGADSGMLYDETVVEPQKLHVPPDTISHTGSQKSSENGDDNDEDRGEINYDGTKIRPKSVSELGQTNKEGFLDKKRKEGQFGFSAWQSRYCIIKDSMMYYYKSKSDGKQCNEIDLSGYEATAAPDVEKKHKRKHLLFIISKPGSRSFQFIAPDEKEMQLWMDAINFASQLAPPSPVKVPNKGVDSVSMSEQDDFGEEYEDLSDYQKTPMGQQAIPAFDEHAQEEGDDFGDEYEDLDEYQKMKIGKMKVEKQPSQDFGETYDDVSVTQGTADSHASVRDTPLPPPPGDLPPPPGELPPRPPPMLSSPLPPPPTMDAPKPPSRDLPSIPPRETSPRDLPPPPADIVISSNDLSEKEPWEGDYRNIYMGKWDCHADEDNELDFKRGDLIHILSQEYDGWWIGEKNYRVGLVPRDFLMKAYI